MYPVKLSSIMDITDGKKIIKESRFSFIRHIDGVTMLKLYSCSNITGLKNVVHKGGQVIIEIPNCCFILFAGDNVYVGANIFHRADGSYLSNLRLFSHNVKK